MKYSLMTFPVPFFRRAPAPRTGTAQTGTAQTGTALTGTFSTGAYQVVALISAALIACLLAACGPREPQLGEVHGADMSRAGTGRDFNLEDVDGKPRTMADYRGKVVMVFFGFTRCPEICPTALQRAKQVVAALGEQGNDVEVLFVSLDPDHDTADRLRAYVRGFNPRFIGLRGSKEQVDKAVRNFNAVYQKVPAGETYTIDHSTLTYVFDRTGHLRVALRHTQPPTEYVDDLRAVLAL